MSLSFLYNIVSLSIAINIVIAQTTFPATPLVSKHFAYPTGIPQKVDTDVGLIRGTQLGYNICNSTTENQLSLCQTSFFNGPDDFCLWAPSAPNKTVGEAEGEMVAWCTKPGHGARLIPAGALTGIQFLKTPDYIQLVGFIDQTLIDISAGDFGGEMDPHGADLRGNPMGGIMYSTNFTGNVVQVIEWTNFVGGNAFCLKACDPAGLHAADFCQHIYDRIGCAFNAPNAAKDKIFEACRAENGDFPGVYMSNGLTQTYKQPPESLGPITTPPYSVRVPSSSNCQTFSSAALFSGLPTMSDTTISGASSSSSHVSTSRSTGQPSTPTGRLSSSQGPATETTTLVLSGFSAFIGVVFAALVLS